MKRRRTGPGVTPQRYQVSQPSAGEYVISDLGNLRITQKSHSNHCNTMEYFHPQNKLFYEVRVLNNIPHTIVTSGQQLVRE